MPRRKKHHHTVPRLHLRGFADNDEQLVQLDVLTGSEQNVSVSNASVRKHFYTITMPDGTRSDAWEDALSEMEGKVAPAIHRAIEIPTFKLTWRDRRLLSTWIALQYLRGPDRRRQMGDIASFTVYAQVGMGGLAYLRHAMSEGLGRAVELEEAEAVWNDITSATRPKMTVSSDEHLGIVNGTVKKVIAMVEARSWGRAQFTHGSLLVSDTPVLLMGDGGSTGNAGLASAPVLAVPLDRRTLLWLGVPSSRGAVRDRDLEAADERALVHNIVAVAGCERFVFRHPEDDVVPDEASVPREPVPRTVITGGEDFANKDRPLQDVLDQIASHTEDDGHSLTANYTWPIPGYRPPDGLGLA